jgi:hypothetical protein
MGIQIIHVKFGAEQLREFLRLMPVAGSEQNLSHGEELRRFAQDFSFFPAFLCS